MQKHAWDSLFGRKYSVKLAKMTLLKGLRMRSLLVMLSILGVLSWMLLFTLFAQLQTHRFGSQTSAGAAAATALTAKIRRSVICNENNANGIGLKDAHALLKLEHELNSGWNQTSRPARVLTLGTHGYIKRDLPVYESAFSQKTMMVAPKPPDGKLREGRDTFDTLLCLSFNTESCLAKEDFRLVGRHRKVNRIKSLREVLWSKNNFCDTLTQATTGFPSSDFFFPCWVLPEQYDKLVADSQRLRITRWISKPRSLGAGMGITIIDELRDIKRHSTHVVQEYMKKPHLLEGADGGKHKWDMRTYVLVTSVVPLRAYVFRRGLVRLATSPYSEDCKSHNQTACLTNTSINKKMEGAKLKDITWSFKKLKDYLTEPVYNKMFLKMQRAISMTLLAAAPGFLREWEGMGDNCEFCYQLLGVDVIFDEKLNAKVIECNGEPSMQTTGGGKTHYDITKKSMIRDLVNLVFQDVSAVSDTSKIMSSAATQCVTHFPGAKVKLKKADASYVLDYLREAKALGEFAPVYPHPVFAEEHRKFLAHISSSTAFPKNIQKQMRTVLHSHDVITELVVGGTPSVDKDDVDFKDTSAEAWDDSAASASEHVVVHGKKGKQRGDIKKMQTEHTYVNTAVDDEDDDIEENDLDDV